MAKTSRSLQRVQDALADHGLTLEVKTFPSSTRTAEDAARSVGCRVEQIAKSLVFRSRRSGDPVIIVTSGGNRVDIGKVSEILGEELEMADANFVRERTGFAVGGVAPVAHDEEIAIYLDRDLFAFERIWAAAGRPDTVFSVEPDELQRMTGGTVIDVK